MWKVKIGYTCPGTCHPRLGGVCRKADGGPRDMYNRFNRSQHRYKESRQA